MSSRSQYGATVNYQALVDYEQETPVCTGFTRTLLNNAILLWEGHAQVRIAWVDQTAIVQNDSPSVNTWQEIIRIPFVTHFNEIGDPFKWRVRLAGRGTSASNGVQFRIAISTADSLAADLAAGTSLSNVAAVSTFTSTTGLWRTTNTNVLTLDGYSATGLSTPDERAYALDLVCGVAGYAATAGLATLCGMYVADFLG